MMRNWCVTGCSLPREMCNPTQVHSWGVWELSTVKYLLCVINDFSNHFTHLSSNLLINYITQIAKASIFTHHALRNQQPPTSLSWTRFLSVEITIGNILWRLKKPQTASVCKAIRRPLLQQGPLFTKALMVWEHNARLLCHGGGWPRICCSATATAWSLLWVVLEQGLHVTCPCFSEEKKNPCSCWWCMNSGRLEVFGCVWI